MIELHKGRRFYSEILNIKNSPRERGIDTFIIELEKMPDGDFNSSFYEIVNMSVRIPVQIVMKKYGTKEGFWVKCYKTTS